MVGRVSHLSAEQIFEVYDENDILIKREWMDEDDTLLFYCTYGYNHNTNNNLILCYNHDDTLSSRREFQYGHFNQKITSKYYDAKGRLIYHYNFRYDENSNIIQQYSYAANDVLKSFLTIQYHSNARRSQINYYHSTGDLNRVDKYDLTGDNVVQQDFYHLDGTFSHRKKYYYDETGKRVREEHYNHEKVLIKIKDF